MYLAKAVFYKDCPGEWVMEEIQGLWWREVWGRGTWMLMEQYFSVLAAHWNHKGGFRENVDAQLQPPGVVVMWLKRRLAVEKHLISISPSSAASLPAPRKVSSNLGLGVSPPYSYSGRWCQLTQIWPITILSSSVTGGYSTLSGEWDSTRLTEALERQML